LEIGHNHLTEATSMIHPCVVRNVFLSLLALVPLACQGTQAGDKAGPAPAARSAGLSAGDLKAARSLAENAGDFRKLLNKNEIKFLGGARPRGKSKDKVYLTRVEVAIPKDDGNKSPEVTQRALGVVVVTHYRYNNDEAVISTLNLDTKKTLKVVTVRHLPVPLADEELKDARSLAFADAKLKKILKPYGNKVEVVPLVHRAPSKKDPAFGHRVVQLLLRVDSSYLTTRVLVDLTDQKVKVETPVMKKDKHMNDK
jgi:hypothetical protein